MKVGKNIYFDGVTRDSTRDQIFVFALIYTRDSPLLGTEEPVFIAILSVGVWVEMVCVREYVDDELGYNW